VNVRSWLFVPGGDERKLLKSSETSADALILDLEDSVSPTRKAAARALVRERLLSSSRVPSVQHWVRINGITTPESLQDLAAVVSAAPDGIVLPKAESAAGVLRLSRYLDALEAQSGLDKKISVMPITMETARGTIELRSFLSPVLTRLVGLTWGAEDLAVSLGASTNREQGEWSFTYRMVRSWCLLTAKAAGIQAVEAVQTDFRDMQGFLKSTRQAAQDGFTGRLAIHPEQVAAIHEAFEPSAAQLQHARRVVAAFALDPAVGAVQFDGVMIDQPHLAQATALLERYGSEAK
jgi:citrate lyase subunit beta / citryl-CoA lyase